MPMRARRRLQLGWGHHFGWHHPFGACPTCGGPAGWSPRWAARPSREEEKESLQDYIAALKEELQDAEEYLKELEEEKQ